MTPVESLLVSAFACALSGGISLRSAGSSRSGRGSVTVGNRINAHMVTLLGLVTGYPYPAILLPYISALLRKILSVGIDFSVKNVKIKMYNVYKIQEKNNG